MVAKPTPTEEIQRTLKALKNNGGNQSAAARELGIPRPTVQSRIEQAEVRGITIDAAPPVPDGFKLKGTSTLYDADGNARLQWVRTTADLDRQREIMQDAIAEMCREIPRVPAIPPPDDTNGHLLNVYTLTDSHVGMRSWPQETGQDWDLSIAESVLVGCFERMVASAPKSAVGVVVILGDFLHYDSAIAPVTPQHGHILDADGRMPKMTRTAIKIARKTIDFALHRHESVVVVIMEGNHDIGGSVWLRELMLVLYEDEPRVKVVDAVLPYYAHQHGNVMLGWHHGHIAKNGQLPLLFAAEFPAIWGGTRKRYIHSGHRHHVEIKEHRGVKVHQHPTLAARDSHSARHGYVSERQVTAITYHREFGEVGTVTVTPEMLA